MIRMTPDRKPLVASLPRYTPVGSRECAGGPAPRTPRLSRNSAAQSHAAQPKPLVQYDPRGCSQCNSTRGYSTRVDHACMVHARGARGHLVAPTGWWLNSTPLPHPLVWAGHGTFGALGGAGVEAPRGRGGPPLPPHPSEGPWSHSVPRQQASSAARTTAASPSRSRRASPSPTTPTP